MAKKSSKRIKELLDKIETTLVMSIPETVRNMAVTEKSYLLLLCYYDLTTDAYTPYIVLAPDEWRNKNQDEEDPEQRSSNYWSPHQSEQFPTTDCEGELLDQHCAECYELLTQEDNGLEEQEQLLPFRKMLSRVALTLNAHDWTGILDTTDDFVVTASDWSGFWVQEDAKRSLPKEKSKLLRKRGYLFNAEQRLVAEVKAFLKLAAGRSISEQIAFWIAQLDAVCQNTPNEIEKRNYDPGHVVKEVLTPLGVVAVPAILELVAKHIDAPGARNHTGDFNDPLDQRLRVMEGLTEHLCELQFNNPEYEPALENIFRRSCDENKNKQSWNYISMKIGKLLADQYGHNRPLYDANYNANITNPGQVLAKREMT